MVGPSAERMPNAHLIAAAPDLYEALERCLNFIENTESEFGDLLPMIATTYENGNGEFRPRIPQYPEIQDFLGTAVNTVLAGALEPQEALDEAQAKALELF